MAIYNASAETMPRAELEALQLERLRTTVMRLLECVPPVRERLIAAGVTDARQLRSLDALRTLPFTTKTDLRDHYPFGLLAVPRAEIRRIHASSGTRGKPTVVAYTHGDLDVFAEVMARTLALGRVEPGMVLHNAYGYGLFTGGLGFHMGGERLGCAVVPISGGFTQRQVMMLQDLGGQVLCCTPSYALSLSQALEEAGVRRETLALRVGLFGAEPWTEEMRAALQARLGLQALNVYGLSEIIGPGVAAECAEVHDGSHIQEDHFLPEIVDPDTGQPVPDGQEGELVLTTLTKEALPMLRYRTRDLSAISHVPCACGRTTARMARIRGRLDDMLIIRGVNLYPSEVERVLLGEADLEPNYQLVVERPASLDELTVVCEPRAAVADRSAVEQRLAHDLQSAIGLTVHVRLVDPGSLPRSEGKAVRVVDRRPSLASPG